VDVMLLQLQLRVLLESSQQSPLASLIVLKHSQPSYLLTPGHALRLQLQLLQTLITLLRLLLVLLLLLLLIKAAPSGPCWVHLLVHRAASPVLLQAGCLLSTNG
jgi:hypothetical protein